MLTDKRDKGIKLNKEILEMNIRLLAFAMTQTA
jgi:hypothetical protein